MKLEKLEATQRAIKFLVDSVDKDGMYRMDTLDEAFMTVASLIREEKKWLGYRGSEGHIKAILKFARAQAISNQ